MILKLKLVKGKCILFVNDVDRCYRLKLFLEQFSIKSCVLNSELPLNSRYVAKFHVITLCRHNLRYHVVQEFNKGVYDYIIASDENAAKGEQDSDESGDEGTADESGEDEECKRTTYLIGSWR